MEILDIFPNIEIEYLTIHPCVNNTKAHIEIGLVSDRDNLQTERPNTFHRAHAKVCVDLSKYFKHEAPEYHHFAQQGLTTSCSESLKKQLATEPEAAQASAAPNISDYSADLTAADLEISKNIQLCQCEQCEFERELDIETGSLFQAFALTDEDMLPDQFNTLNI